MAKLPKLGTSYIVFVSMICNLCYCATITCPTLYCSVELDTNTGYLHDSSQPTSTLKGQSCSSSRICEFSTTSGEFAWYSEATQSVSSGTSSNIQGKEVQAFCQIIESTKQNLYAGRNCGSDNHCYSGECNSGVGSGFSEGEYGAVNADGGANMFCKKSTKWPFRAKGNSLLGDMEICTSDYEGGARYFGWYATSTEKSAGTQRCLDKFSSSDGQIFGWNTAPTTSSLSDQEYNGQFGESGYAVQNATDTNMAICKSVTSITYNGVTLSSPYSCTPTDNAVTCHLVYGTGASEYTETTCKGALDGTNGYCGSIAGTSEFQKYTQAMKTVLESSLCHTLDRDNLRAQKESGGIATSTDQWRYAIQKRFNVTYWAYTQTTSSRDGVEAIFADSYTNLSKDSAVMNMMSAQAFAVLLLFLVTI